MTWCCCIFPVLKGQHLFAGELPCTPGHAIQDSYGYLPFLGIQHSKMWEFEGFGKEKSDMCGLFVNSHELSVVWLHKDREELRLGLCWPLNSLWMRQIGVCQLGSLIPNSSQTGIFGFKRDWSCSHVNSRFCTKLIWANSMPLWVVGRWVLPNGELRQPNVGFGVGNQTRDESTVILETDKWPGLQKQSTKSLRLEGKVCPFNQTQATKGNSSFCNTGEKMWISSCLTLGG